MVKLRAGRNANGSVLTRMIRPVQPLLEKDHRSDITLSEQFINNRGTKCYRFRYRLDNDNGPIMTTAARWVKLVQEGHADDFFEDVQQPRTNTNKSQLVESGIKWQDSKARKILYNDIVKNIIPLEAKDAHNKSTMKLRDIYNMHPEEYHQYDYTKFSSRLSSLRAIVKK